MPRHRRTRISVLALGLVGLALCAACSSSDDAAGGAASTTTANATATTISESGVTISEPWARTTAEGQDAGAAYMTLTSDEDRAIVSASAPIDIAGTVELHETVAADASDGSTTSTAADSSDTIMGDMGGTDDMSGAMTMRPVDKIDLPAGEPVTLEPGGLHIMLLDLAAPLEAGETFTVTLTLDDGTTVPVDVTVSDEAP